ncbi:MAG: CtsR family transcriptional regulator [Clostridia bacterium]|nr:CtsR family transcriptional regulator [Clostridia bacterium]
MGTSDKIESFILELLKNDDNDWIELGRNELASVFNCVPSQINYVISTRFNADKGYIVESRRGGGGYLRIKKIKYNESDLLFKAIEKIGASIDSAAAKSIVGYLASTGTINENAANLILAAVSEKSIPQNVEQKDTIRANILKNMLLTQA